MTTRGNGIGDVLSLLRHSAGMDKSEAVAVASLKYEVTVET